jgi:hypothetical protein
MEIPRILALRPFDGVNPKIETRKLGTLFINGNLSLISVSQPRGSLHEVSEIPRISAPLPHMRAFATSFSAEIASSRRIRAEDKNQGVSVHR